MTGQNGGIGQNPQVFGAGGGGGGAGGYGLVVTGGYGTFRQGSFHTTGGDGGTGGVSSIYAYTGRGGDGGAGIGLLGTQEALINEGTVTGGIGAQSLGRLAGTGGDGIVAFGTHDTIDNTSHGVISGGAGGKGHGFVRQGAGGAGIVGQGMSIRNDGLIRAGSGGGYNYGGDAITFTGGDLNSLSIGMGSRISGAVDIESGMLTFAQVTGPTGDPADATLTAPIIGGGMVVKAGTGTLTLIATTTSPSTYTGGTEIEGGALQLTSSVAAGASTGAIAFAAPTGQTAELELESGAQPASNGTFGYTLSGFGSGDSLDLEGLSYTSATPVTAEIPVNGTLSVTENGETENFTLANAGSATYYAHDDGSGGTLIDDNPLCFCSDTLIRTFRGDVPVQCLKVGDLAVTASGATRPIRWIGHRTIGAAELAIRPDMSPVRVRAGAFERDRPARDLYLSPGHPVLVGAGDGEVLVPIMCLINGTTIERMAREHVTYWHVELDRHDVLLAENLPAESFLDYGVRPWFEDGADHDLHNPDVIAPGLAGRCRPVAIDGPKVEMERRRLDQVFAGVLAAQCDWPVADQTNL